jgi:hypothetical protein
MLSCVCACVVASCSAAAVSMFEWEDGATAPRKLFSLSIDDVADLRRLRAQRVSWWTQLGELCTAEQYMSLDMDAAAIQFTGCIRTTGFASTRLMQATATSSAATVSRQLFGCDGVFSVNVFQSPRRNHSRHGIHLSLVGDSTAGFISNTAAPMIW